MSRYDELAAGLEVTRRRIATACDQAGRDHDEVTLVVVTKLFPASDVRLLHQLGVRNVGENRHQEAAQKHADCSDLDLTWHFVGSLQTNKAAAVASYVDVVHSVDRIRLLAPLARGAQGRGTELDVLLQVDLDAEPKPRRGGASPGDVPELAEAVRSTGGLRLRGVMAVAPLGQDPSRAFAELAELSVAVRSQEPLATWISAGMSGDLEQAIAAGATHVRVGSGILGSRVVGR